MSLSQTMISAAAPLPATTTPYRLGNLSNLTIGYSITPSWSHQLPMDGFSSTRLSRQRVSNGYGSSLATQTPPGIYNARQLVASATPLLDAVIARLGLDPPNEPPSRTILINGLAASLATSGRESTLPLTNTSQDTARTEIVNQVNRVAKSIVKYVHETLNPNGADPNLRIRSPCEGHLWTPAVASLLLGPRSDSQMMEIYNEWLHQMILLRDSLLPFENYDEVPLVIPESSMGIRDLEEPRKFFLVHCLTGNVQNMAIVDLAKVFTGRNLPRGGYGFQYSQGVILPAFLSGSRSLHLLRYHHARFHDSVPEILFDYEHKEYINAPHTELTRPSAPKPVSPSTESTPTAGRWNLASLLSVDTTRVTESSLAIDSANDALRCVVKLRLTLSSGTCVSVDLGQIARGRRYAYEVRSDKTQNGTSKSTHTNQQSTPLSPPPETVVHDTVDILSRPGLVISPRTQSGRSSNTVHIIPSTDPIIKLALLGKLYPENVILLREKDDIDALAKTGKGFSERLVILEKSATSTV